MLTKLWPILAGKADANGNTILQNIFSNLLIRTSSSINSRTADVVKTGKPFHLNYFEVYFEAAEMFFYVVNCQRADKKKSSSDANKNQPTFNDGLEDLMCVRVLGVERLPAASYDLQPNLRKKKVFFFAI